MPKAGRSAEIQRLRRELADLELEEREREIAMREQEAAMRDRAERERELSARERALAERERKRAKGQVSISADLELIATDGHETAHWQLTHYEAIRLGEKLVVRGTRRIITEEGTTIPNGGAAGGGGLLWQNESSLTFGGQKFGRAVEAAISISAALELTVPNEGSTVRIRLTVDEATKLGQDLIRFGARHRRREFGSGAPPRWP